ncbi:AAA family ATPase [Clostridioides sp. ZZV14-6045]|uniref:ATPase n=1 Tax=Clostridioides sp. ZZV14-6045 TaxID=2811489 RepID=UPI001D13028C|nr:AAA family ATPase [Clostridioides sp. ZZV14-6045]
MKKILLSIGQPTLDNKIKIDVIPKVGMELVGEVENKEYLIEKIEETNPDLLIISKMLKGAGLSILELLLTIKREYPKLRIIFLAGEVDEKNKEKYKELAVLVKAGIYDILHKKSIKPREIVHLIENPNTRKQVEYLLKYEKDNVIYEDEIVEIEEEKEVKDLEKEGYKNVYVISSIKPGTGKSFLSTNIATNIAKYGRNKDGSRPKVALVESDLQNLSVGTLLQIEDSNKNLKNVMEKIDTIIVNGGESLVDDPLKIKSVNEYIRSCFKQYKNCKNLWALTGSQFTMEEIENIKNYHYTYLIENILDDFDVIIIDTNSALDHVSTYPLLRLCNTAYYILNLDFNNIRNNSKYKETLDNINVLNKIKYVLNEDIDKDYKLLTGETMLEELTFKSDMLKENGFKVIAKIPEIPKEIFLNRLYQGIPIVLDNTNYTLKARLELAKVAKEICEIENFDWLCKEYQKYSMSINEKLNKTKKKKFSLFNKK